MERTTQHGLLSPRLEANLTKSQESKKFLFFQYITKLNCKEKGFLFSCISNLCVFLRYHALSFILFACSFLYLFAGVKEGFWDDLLWSKDHSPFSPSLLYLFCNDIVDLK